MRSSELLVECDDFAVGAVVCAGGHADWSAPEHDGEYGIVLVRSGLFRVRNRGVETLAEPTTAYLQGPGAELEFAHPAGGDICTAVNVSPALWHAVAQDASPGASVTVDGRLELAHLLLLRATTDRDVAFGLAERFVGLLGRAVRSVAPHRSRARHHASGRLAAAAREAIATDDPCAVGLLPLAASLGVSPYHLSRTFTAHTGQSVTRYRNRVRVSRALHRLDAGETDLARLASELGFADQSHLTRTVKAQVGHPPGVLRRLLAS